VGVKSVTTFVKAISDLLALLLQALRLSAILPAAVFVTLNAIFVLPQLRGTEVYDTLQCYSSSFFWGSLAVVAVLLIGYSLAVLNISIIRLFEGYPLLAFSLGRRLRLSNLRRIEYLQSKVKLLNADIQMWRKREENPTSPQDRERAKVERQRCELERNLLAAELAWMHPQHQTWRTLPTRLGNVIAAAEEYSGHLYEMDSVTLWPYLTPVLTQEGYAPFIEKEKATFDFLLNMTVLTLLFGVELAYVEVLLYGFQWGPVLFQLGLATTVAFGFYLLSIQGALSWGFTIRTAFVLYRGHLRERLGLKRPKTYTKERILWKKTSAFFREHDRIQGDLIFSYKSEETDKEKTQPESTVVNATISES